MSRLLSVSEVAEHLGCRKETVRRYILDGRLPALQIIGGFYRVREEDISQLLQPVGAPVEAKPEDGRSDEGPRE